MELLYAIITILFLGCVLTLMFILFKNKERPKKPSIINSFSGFLGKNDAKSSALSEYKLEKNTNGDGLNLTICDIAMYVTITHAREPEIKTESVIYEDKKFDEEGVIIGRSNTDYILNNLLIDIDGTFMIRKNGPDYIVVANRNSVNGIRKQYKGKKERSIPFIDGSATVYVGPIRFDFNTDKPGTNHQCDNVKKSNFYSNDSINVKI